MKVLVNSQYELLAGQAEQIAQLEARIQQLEAQTRKNSGNSSKPPASDGLKKSQKRSLRGKSGKRQGGQKGHPGQTLAMVGTPDAVVVHEVTACAGCGADLRGVAVSEVDKRPVFELPEVRLRVTEHRAERKGCACCGQVNRAAFPEAVTQPTQYGPRFRAQLAYFHSGQFIPLARTAELVEGLYGQPVAEATILNAVAAVAQQATAVTDALKAYLVDTPEAVHCDETGARVNGSLPWVHSAGTTQATVYDIHPKRGQLGIDALGVLPTRRGWCVHDGWKPYATYAVRHALCNAHHLRELTFLYEQYQFAWADELCQCLVQMKNAVARAQDDGHTALSLDQYAYFTYRYDHLLAAAEAALDPSPDAPDPPPSHKTARNLLKRLREGRLQVLAFLTDFTVPFDNNLAERDIRMVKVQQKVSGGFRSLDGARAFCAIRSYVATARKNGQSALAAIHAALTGSPFFPPCVTPTPAE